MAAEQLTGYAARATIGVARADTAARRTAWERSMAEDMMVVVNKKEIVRWRREKVWWWEQTDGWASPFE